MEVHWGELRITVRPACQRAILPCYKVVPSVLLFVQARAPSGTVRESWSGLADSKESLGPRDGGKVTFQNFGTLIKRLWGGRRST